jgi:hypothetical protein
MEGAANSAQEVAQDAKVMTGTGKKTMEQTGTLRQVTKDTLGAMPWALPAWLATSSGLDGMRNYYAGAETNKRLLNDFNDPDITPAVRKKLQPSTMDTAKAGGRRVAPALAIAGAFGLLDAGVNAYNEASGGSYRR